MLLIKTFWLIDCVWVTIKKSFDETIAIFLMDIKVSVIACMHFFLQAQIHIWMELYFMMKSKTSLSLSKTITIRFSIQIFSIEEMSRNISKSWWDLFRKQDLFGRVILKVPHILTFYQLESAMCNYFSK